MEEWEQDKLFAIAEYLDDEIPSRATIQPISPMSPVRVLTVRTPPQTVRLESEPFPD